MTKPKNIIPQSKLIELFDLFIEDFPLFVARTVEEVSQGRAVRVQKRFVNEYPTLTTFYRAHLISPADFEWYIKNYTHFAAAVEKINTLQEDVILKHCLTGAYSAKFGEFILKNKFGYKDKQELIKDDEIKMTFNIVPFVKPEEEDKLNPQAWLA
jgi:hypothetical protein